MFTFLITGFFDTDTLEEEAEKVTGSFSVSNSFLDQVQRREHLKKLLCHMDDGPAGQAVKPHKGGSSLACPVEAVLGCHNGHLPCRNEASHEHSAEELR